jgi:hypothetical protein
VALSWRALPACGWSILLLGVPLSVADVCVFWFTASHLSQEIPQGWQEMILLCLGVPTKCIAYVSIICAAIAHMEGRSTPVRDVLRIPWRRMPAVLVMGLIVQAVSFWPMPLLDWSDASDSGLALNYGILTINVLACDVLAFMALPILLIENRSIVGTLRRGIQLARGCLWRILAIDIALWLLYFVLSEVVSQAYRLADPAWSIFVWIGMAALSVILMMSLGCAVVAATYHLIRGEREGPAPESLARVFE